MINVSNKLVLGAETFKASKEFYNKFSFNRYYTTEDGESIGAFVYDNHEKFKKDEKYANQDKIETDAILFMHGKALERYMTSEYVDMKQVMDLAKRPMVIILTDYREFADNDGIFTKKGGSLDIDAGVKWVRENYNVKNIAFVAHSFGCGITIEYFRYKYLEAQNKVEKTLMDFLDECSDSFEMEEENESDEEYSSESEELEETKVNIKNSGMEEKEKKKLRLEDLTTVQPEFTGEYLKDLPEMVFLLAPFCSFDVARKEYLLAKLFGDAFETYDKSLASMYDYNGCRDLKFIKKPYLFHGIDDVILGKNHTEELVKENSHAHAKYYENMGHLKIFSDLKVWTDIFEIFYSQYE